MINTEKNNKTVKLSNLIEKIWILGVIGFYIYLYVSQNFSNYIGKQFNLMGVFGVIILIVLFLLAKPRNRKIGASTLVFIISISLIVYAGDGKASDSVLNRKGKQIGVNTANYEKTKQISDDNEYEFKGVYLTADSNTETEYIKPVKKKYISVDPETETWYIDNRILVGFKQGVTKDEIQEFIKKYNLKIVGEMKSISQYMFELDESLSLQKMLGKIREINNLKNIDENTKVQVADVVYATQEMINELKNTDTTDNLKAQKQELAKRYIEGDSVVEITVDNFMKVMEAIYENPDMFKDKKIKITGRTFKAEEIKEGYIGIGLWKIYCCAIDMTLVGYPVKADGKMEEGKWYELQGKIQVENGEPYIEYMEAKQVEEPKENQIY
ncbi:MAG: DUF1980 domain-containing protein [Clostridiales bacterium]|nr:DUF1980 domain-containing protein [Clostridiales bacterium]